MRARLRCLRYGVPEPPSSFQNWTLSLIRPPYRVLTDFEPARAVGAVGKFSDIPAGEIVVGIPMSVNQSDPLDELVWLFSFLPWYSLAVRVPSGGGPAFLSLVNRLARYGAVVIPGASVEPDEIAEAVTRSFDPRNDLPRWLSAAVAQWSDRRRRQAVRQFIVGFGYDSESPHGQLQAMSRSRGPIWLRVGRGVRAGVNLQLEPDLPLRQVARRSGFFDSKAMERSIWRLFGVRARDIRGTMGLNWLLWRFVSGQGHGREIRWDRPFP